MANILISHFSTIVENGRFTPGCFFEGLAKSFQEGGHNVKHMISTSFIPKAWNGTNTMYKDVKRQRLIQDIKDFSPDLCIFGNNSVPEAVYEATDCPVIILLSDTAAFLNDKELIKTSHTVIEFIFMHHSSATFMKLRLFLAKTQEKFCICYLLRQLKQKLFW